jgi:hypothetical protein
MITIVMSIVITIVLLSVAISVVVCLLVPLSLSLLVSFYWHSCCAIVIVIITCVYRYKEYKPTKIVYAVNTKHRVDNQKTRRY